MGRPAGFDKAPKGHGSALADEWATFDRMIGCSSIGFNEFGRRPNYYPAKKGREDALVMAIELLPPE